MRNSIILFAAFNILLVFSLEVNANNEKVARDYYIKNAERVGQKAKLSYLIWDVYYSELFAENGKFDRVKPFSIKLEYLRGADAQKIANISIDEIRSQGFRDSSKLSQWKEILAKNLPDVKENDSIEGISANGRLIFIYNGEKFSEIKDEQLTKKFFDIWLSEKTSEQRLRKKLLGEI